MGIKADDIAVIGMAGKFPGANNVAEFWENICAKKESIRQLSDEELRAAGVSELDIADCAYVKASAPLDDVDMFDPAFFKISPREAELMDPQIRLLLQCAWEALEDAGYVSKEAQNIGVFAGSGGVTTSYFSHFANLNGHFERVTASPTHLGNDKDFLATYISYKLNLTGPSVTVQTACSTSLVALHQARQSLLAGECDMALAGGVTVRVPHGHGYHYKEGYIFSRSGCIKTFDASADGVVFGSGLGLVLIKRLADAVRDGDHIYAVIKGSAIVNDGKGKMSYAASSAKGQITCVRAALKNAGMSANAIGFVESHGTGTSMGDPEEVKALSVAFKEYTDKKSYCVLGAVKTNVGHLEAAAGITGFIKAVLAVKNGLIPPTAHYTTPNPRIRFENTPFYVNREPQAWDEGKKLRVAAVNSLGVGGTNAFVVVEEYFPAKTAKRGYPASPPFVVPLSAKSEASLRAYAKKLDDFLFVAAERKIAVDLGDLAYTLQTGREAMECRVVFVVATLDELRASLARYRQGETESMPTGEAADLAAMWVAGDEIDWRKRYTDAIRPRRISLPTYVFAKERFWVDSGSLAPSCAMIHPLLHTNISDLDEQRYSATFSGEEFFLRDHRARTRSGVGQDSLPQKVLPGVVYLEMARVAIEQAASNRYDTRTAELRDVVWLQPITVSEDRRVNIALLASGPASGPEGRIDFEIYTQDDHIHCQGRCLFRDEEVLVPLDAAQLKASMSRSVWTADEVYAAFAKMGLSYGPSHRVLTTIHRGERALLAYLALPPMVEAGFADYVLHPSLMDGALQAATTLLFELDDVPIQPIVPFSLESLRVIMPCARRMYAWARHAQGTQPTGGSIRLDIDLFDDEGKVCVQMRGFTPRALGRESPGSLFATQVWLPSHPALEQVAHVEQHVILCEFPRIEARRIAHDCMPFSFDPAQDIAQRYHALALVCFDKARALLNSRPQGKALIQLVLPNTEEHAVHAGLAALFKTAHLENPQIAGQVIFVDAGIDNEALVGLLHAECGRPHDTLIRHEGSARQLAGWRFLHEEEAAAFVQSCLFKDRGVYLITGGLGGLGVLFAKEILARSPGARIILSGRAAVAEIKQSASKKASLDALQAMGVVEYRQLDLEDSKQVEKQIAAIRKKYKQLNGIIHSAGMTADGFTLKKTADEFSRVLVPKVHGTLHLDQAARDVDLDFLVLFSSLSAAVGNMGQADYAVANGFLDGFAAQRNRLVAAGQRRGLTLSIRWPLWQDGGMRPNASGCVMLHEMTGISPMSTATGMRMFYRSMAAGLDQTLVMEGDMRRMRRVLGLGAALHAVTTERFVPRFEPIAATAGNLTERAERYLCTHLAASLKLPPHKVDPRAPFEDYGIDSILALDLTRLLEKTFGVLPKTLFFEYLTISALAAYFVKEHAAILTELFDTGETNSAVTAPAQADVQPAEIVSLRLGSRRFAPDKAVVEPCGASAASDPIAIVGLSGRYPESRDLQAFWRNLRDGKDCIVEVPKERWDWREYYSADRSAKGCHYSKWGGFIEGVDEFDARFFNISPLEAEILDPQERLFLQHAWMAIEDAGYTRATLQIPYDKDLPAQVGVYAGVMYGEYQLFGAEASLQGRRMGFASNPASIANRVSYFLNLHGPSMVVDTMCSSSLTAIHLACQDLLLGRTSLAIAGGVNVTIHPNKYLMLSAGQFISGDGHCQSFGEGGDGYIPGEGVGVAVLKRLSEAQRDGNPIYGIIRGSALSHGGKTNGYTVPNPQAQASAIRQALAEAALDARHISYVEAHGTGTKLGDPIEIAALTKVFQESTQDIGYCPIGSAKSNIGHAEAAAGIAGLTKVLLQMKHGCIVPSLHSNQLNPHIDFGRTPFVVNQTLRPWQRPVVDGRELPRIAGISSFGAGGSNAHLIVEEYVQPVMQPVGSGEYIVPLSARGTEQLRQKARDLVDFLCESAQFEGLPPILAEIAYTLQVGREAMDERLAVVADSVTMLADKLCAYLDGEAPGGVFQGRAKADKETLSPLTQDPELHTTLIRWMASGQYAKLAELWVKGLELDWQGFHAQKPRLISLPAYPFLRQRHWIDAARRAPVRQNVAVLHPLVHRNTSSFDQFRYAARFDGDEFFLLGEPGRRRLSESTCLEMARVAFELAMPAREKEGILELREVAWAQPGLVIGDDPLTLALFDRRGEQVSFELCDGDGDGETGRVHCQGHVVPSVKPAPARVDLAAISTQPGQLLTELNLPPELRDGQEAYVLHPALIQQALQTIASFGDGLGRVYSMTSLRLVRPAMQAKFVWARRMAGTLDIDLCTEQGDICVEMRGLRYQASEKPAASVAASLFVGSPAKAVGSLLRRVHFDAIPASGTSVPATAKPSHGIALQAPALMRVSEVRSEMPRPIQLGELHVPPPSLANVPEVTKPRGIVLGEPTAVSLSAGVAAAKPKFMLRLPVASSELPRADSPVALFDHGNGVFAIHFDAPASGNALTAGLVADLLRALRAVEAMSTAKVLMLEGRDDCFLRGGLVAHSDALAAGLYAALADFPYPVIAAARGDALGAGFLVAALCDFVVCSETAHYAFAMAQEGLYPSAAEDLLVERFGRVHATDFLYLSVEVSGAELKAKGWTCAVVASDQVVNFARALAANLALKPQSSLRLLKQNLGRHLAATARALPVPGAGVKHEAVDVIAPEFSSPYLALEVYGERILRATIRAQAKEAEAQVLLADFAELFSRIAETTAWRCVVFVSELSGFLPECAEDIREKFALGCSKVLREFDRPVVTVLDSDTEGVAWLIALSCDACVYSEPGRYSGTAVLRDPALAPDIAAAFSQHFGANAAQRLLFAGGEATGLELRIDHGLPHVAAADQTQTRALRIAEALAVLPQVELTGWKRRRMAALEATRAAFATMPVTLDEMSEAIIENSEVRPVTLVSSVISAVAHPEGILEVRMADRDAKNMFSEAFSDGLREVFAQAERSACKVVVLTGYDNYFSSGGTPETLLAIHGGKAKFTDNTVFQLPLNCPVPVIAAMQGHGIGAGWALGMYADFTLFSDESRYLSPYMGYGFTPGAGSTLMFPARIGYDLARETLLSAREYSGGELKARGLPDAVLPRGQVLPAALSLARRIACSSRERLVALKEYRVGPLRAALADTFERELAMHERTFVGQTDTLARIQDRFSAQTVSDTPPAAAAVSAPVSVDFGKLLDSLRRMLADELRMREHEIDDDEKFVDLGLDSITGVTWIRRINETYGTDIEAIKVYSYPTLNLLARFIQQETAVVAAATPSVPQSELDLAAMSESFVSVTATLRGLLAYELRMQEDEIGENEQFVDLGLDSVTGVTWVRRINEQYGTSIEAIKVYSYPTLRQFGAYVCSEVDKSGEPANAEVFSAPVAIAVDASAMPMDRQVLRSWQARQRAGIPVADGLQPIAVIGMAGRFAKAGNLEEFWHNIAQGRDCIEEVPKHRWDIDLYYQEGEAAPGKTYSRWMGVLDEHDQFDAAFFNISPREARSMDPQQRLFLQACWHGIEHAGYDPRALAGSRCGVFVGCSAGDYHQLSRREQLSGQGFTGAAMSVLAARISYLLDLHGPSLAIDTACSSSLVAIATACDSLVSRGSDLALAGGVNVMAGPAMQIMTAQVGMLSPRGRCFTFDAQADGIVNGEGVGVVVLKRLADAERDGDYIYGVVEGWGVNQDGKTNGITAPNADSQTRLQQEVYDRFGVDPADIGLIEAHGTGTALGDPIEVAGLKAAFAKYTRNKAYCALGSVKSNIGHCLTAAGVSGFLKVLLALEHGQLPPTIHFSQLNKHISLDDSPFYINDRLREWRRTGTVPRRAAVSAFGFGGTNAHVVVAEYLGRQDSARQGGRVIVPLSARTEEQLARAAQALLAFLRGRDVARLDLDRIAHTLQVGREPMNERAAFIVASLAELENALQAFVAQTEGAVTSGRAFRGQVSGNKDTLLALSADPDFQIMIGKWMDKRELPRLADLWVKGLALDWSVFHAGVAAPRRIGLPGYPFATERYWIEAGTNEEATTATVDLVTACEEEMFAWVRPSQDDSQMDIDLLNRAGELCARLTGLTMAPPVPRPVKAFVSAPSAASVVGVSAAPSMVPAAVELMPSLSQLQQELRVGLAEVLFMQPNEVDTRKSFTELGLDSIIGVEWVKAINRRYGTAVAATRIYDYPSVSELASFLHGEIGGQGAPAMPASVEPERSVPSCEILQQELRESLAAVLFMQPAEVNPRKSFTELGLDSIIGVEWVKAINKRYGTAMTATRIYDYPCVGELAAFLHGEIGGRSESPGAPAISATPAAPVAVELTYPASILPREALLQDLRESLAEVLFMRPAELDVGKSFTELGLDSIIGVEWVKAINKRYGTAIAAARIYDYPNVKELAAYLYGEIGGQTGSIAAPTTLAASAATERITMTVEAVTPVMAPPTRLWGMRGIRFVPKYGKHYKSLYFHSADGEGDFDHEGEFSLRFAISPDQNVCLREHVVFGEHLFPTDAFVELVYSAYRTYFSPDDVQLKNIVIANPLLGVDGRETQLKLVFRRTGEELQFFVRSSPSPDFSSDTLHMQGFIARADDCVASRFNESFAVDKTLVATEIPTNTGRYYAPLQSLRFGESAALGLIRVAEHSFGFLGNPFALYGGLCTVINYGAHLAARHHGASDDQFLPYRIGRIALLGPLDGTDYRCYAEIRGQQDDALEFYFELVDAQAKPVLVVESIVLRRVARATLKQHVAAAPALSMVRSPPGGGAGVPTEKVAIIGMSCRYAMSENVEALWENLKTGKDCVVEIPAERWGPHGEWYHPDPRHPHTSFSKWSGLLDHIDHFDALFFGISPAEAELIDPQQRIFLEECWRTIESAGYAPGSLANQVCGVYVGCAGSDYVRVLESEGRDSAGAAFMGNSTAILAARISYHLNLKGPALAVDTACSSSLVAVHLACESIRNGENVIALAGGINVLTTPIGHILTSQVGMLSRDGRCAAFDTSANGIVFSEGCGVVLLKALSAAERDNDDILGVIEGSGTNQDGKTNGITAPSANAQKALLRQVYDKFGIDPARIGYVEAHGTATPLGDPIEVDALSAVFGRTARGTQSCALGSVKSNIGHAGFAAGVAGIVKVLLCLRHHKLVPSIHYHQPNPHIDFGNSPFYVNTEYRDWVSEEPRLACVSSFGFSGTNAHIVIGEHVSACQPQRAGGLPSNKMFVPLSAKTEDQLRQHVRNLADFLCRQEQPVDFPRLAYTLQVGRDAMEHRLAFVVGSVEELAAKLRNWLAGESGTGGTGVYRGRASHGEETLAVFAADADMRALVGRWVAHKNLNKVAELWVRGFDIDLSALHDGRRPRRMALPTYPFAHERCWVGPSSERKPVARKGATRLHPLLHRNTSNLGQQRYSSDFDGTELFLADHRVNGVPVLPAVAYLEMARAALSDALPADEPSRQFELRHVVWAQPIMVSAPRQVVMEVFVEDDDQFGFEVYSHDGEGSEVLHCQGHAVVGAAQTTPALDLPGLRARMSRPVLDGGVLYPLFATMGLQYGPAFQGIVALHQGERQSLVELRLPKAVRADAGIADYVLHPSLLDSALQGSIPMIDDLTGRDSGRPALPFALESLRILSACPEHAFAWVRYAPDGRGASALVKIDIDLCDTSGRVCAQMRGFSSRPWDGGDVFDEDRYASIIAGIVSNEISTDEAVELG